MSIPIYMSVLSNPGAPPEASLEWEIAMNMIASGKKDVIVQFHPDGKTTREFI
jgi:hypothetical protein